MPMGVFRAVRETTYDAAVHEQIARARAKGVPDLASLLREGDTWTV
jgi:hypothetical protein